MSVGESFPGADEQRWQELVETVHACRLCPRLVEWRERAAREKRRAYRHEEYWGKPVSGWGDHNARLLVVGLAPAAHGGNRTGRVFTGDSSGDFLFAALFKAGFANQPNSDHRGDGLQLRDVYIGAAARCAPPDNRPTLQEMDTCQVYLEAEMQLLKRIEGIVVLGQIAFDRVLKLLRQKGHDIPPLKFGHNLLYELGEGLPWLLTTYHPSRQNTQTGRLTQEMFTQVWLRARDLLGSS